MPWSTSFIPALQNVPLISSRSSSYLREKRRQLRAVGAVEGSTRTAPNFVSMEFGDGRGAERRSSGDARRDVVLLDLARAKISIAAVAPPCSPNLKTSLRPTPLT